MIERTEMTMEYVDELLEKAVDKVAFGKTDMGIVVDAASGAVAIGRRCIPRLKPNLFPILGLLGPLKLSNVEQVGNAERALQNLLCRVKAAGMYNEMYAVVADSNTTFGLYAEGIILSFEVNPDRKQKFAEGVFSIDDVNCRFFAFDGHGVPGIHGLGLAAVDGMMRPLPTTMF